MIKRKAIRNATTTVVSGQVKFGESKFIHHGDKFVRHGSLCIRVVIFRGSRHTAAAIAAKIDTNHRVVARETWRHLAPHQAGSRKSMNHEQRGSISVAPDENCVVIGPDLRGLKVIGGGRGGLIKRSSGSAVP